MELYRHTDSCSKGAFTVTVTESVAKTLGTPIGAPIGVLVGVAIFPQSHKRPDRKIITILT